MNFKLIIGLSVFLIFSTSIRLQSEKIPNEVSRAFMQAYPNVKGVKWDKEESNFEANFSLNGKKMAVVYNCAGKCIEIEESISLNEIPQIIINNVHSLYKNWTITELAKITRANKTVLFEVQITQKRHSKELLFDELGNPGK
ncbi:MAG: hypothetical protein LWX56_14860 [Ignavibacteria bacterium]|nr:hypothetical protein [Ignavibacteria bacterium]